ncbi:MAG: sugar ABC transporter ATP-binding protein [Deltaproteobacteria bacterium]
MIPFLHLSNLQKSFGSVPVLRGVELALFSGEIHGLMGENGAGKSTLIKILSGNLVADSITCSMNGESLSLVEARQSGQLGMRFIHQELNSIPHLSVAENLMLGKQLPTRAKIFVNQQKLAELTQVALAELGVTHIDPRQRMSQLGAGDQMLVKLGSAFVVESSKPAAQLYVLDEPTASLMPSETEKLFAALDRLKQKGGAILYVSHRLDEIFQITDRITVLRDGRNTLVEKTEMLKPRTVVEAMTGREISQHYPGRSNILSKEVLLSVQNLRNAKLKSLNFTLHKGEILGLAGLGGSGRSEVLRTLLGIRDFSGTLTLEGQLWQPRLKNFWQERLAFIPEERRSQGLVLNQTVATNSHLPFIGNFGKFLGLLPQQKLRQKSEEAWSRVKVQGTGISQRIWQLSGGNQQKVLFARATWNQPKLLLLDEPTRGVDVGAKQEIYSLIRQASQEGTSVLLVSSELGELIGLCDRILVLRDGQIHHELQTNGLREADLLAYCQGVRATEITE